MNHELRTATMADLGAEQIRRADEVVKVAKTSGNLRGTYVKTLKETAKFFTLNATEMARRADSAHGVVAIMEARMIAMEAGIAAFTKELASHFVTEKSGESPLAAIECEIEELGTTALTRLIERRLEDIDGKKEMEAVSKQTTRRADNGAPNTPVTKGGQAAVIEWQTVERRRKSKKASVEKQPARTTPGSGSKNPRKAPERKTESAGKGVISRLSHAHRKHRRSPSR